MITEKGKQIIGKYLIGQASSFANYIAIGCGVDPIKDNSNLAEPRKFKIVSATASASTTVRITIASTQVSNIVVGDKVVLSGLSVSSLNSADGFTVTKVEGKSRFYFEVPTAITINQTPSAAFCYVRMALNENLYFEMERFPIIAKSFYRDPIDQKLKLIFKAEIPSEQRYKITEVGLFPARYDESNATGDSKKVAIFLSKEGWRRVNPDPTTYFDALIGITSGSIEAQDGSVSVTNNISFVTDANAAWASSSRVERNEVPRFLTESLLVDGFYSEYDGVEFDETAAYIQNPSIFLNLSQNSPDDLIKIAASIVPKQYTVTTLPEYVAFKIEFSNQTSTGDQKRAYVTIEKTFDPNTTNAIPGSDLDRNYFVVSTRIGDFVRQDPEFSWANITGIKIWAYVANFTGSTNTAADYYVLLDGMRVDSVNRSNPLYGMIAHNVVSTSDGTPILKKENTSSYIEFKLDLGE
jgi:hypothetical protein